MCESGGLNPPSQYLFDVPFSKFCPHVQLVLASAPLHTQDTEIGLGALV